MHKLFSKKTAACFVIVLLVLSVSRCHHTKGLPLKSDTITVTSKPITSTLFYAGTIQPLKTVAIISPAEGVIEEMAFHYGDTVKPGQVLLAINSQKFRTDYKAALIQYVKARSELNNNQSQLTQSDFLHKNLLISDDEFKNKQNNFYNAQLTFLQAKDVLGMMLKQLDLKGFNLYDISIEDIDKITAALHAEGDTQTLQIVAPTGGVILSPMKNDGSNETAKKFQKGGEVKQGEVVAEISEAGGCSIHINVSEFDVNQLKVGQHVNVTGAAFPDFVLQGTVSSVDHQGQSSQTGLPNFSVEVVVPTLTLAEQAVIHVGMSAKLEVNLEAPSQITIPIAAVTEKAGLAYVYRRDAETGNFQELAVRTGKTTQDSVVILDKLKSGDVIAVPHNRL